MANNPITGMQNVKLAGLNKKPEDTRLKEHVAATEASPKESESPNSQVIDIGQRRNRACRLCSGNFHLDVCPNFLKKNLADRTRYIKESRLCFGCFKPNHVGRG